MDRAPRTDIDIDALADRLFAAVQEYCEREHSKSAAVLAEARAVVERVLERPAPRDGVDGKDGAAGKDGKDGEQGAQGAAGERGEQGLPGAAGKDGRDGIDGKDGALGREGERGPRGERGERGIDGRDALELDVLEALDAGKAYARGTFAKHDGGLLRAFRKTDPLLDNGRGLEACGWQVLVNGLSACTWATLDDRRARIVLNLTDGTEAVHDLYIPSPVYRGVWTQRDYERGDVVTRDGCMWHAERDTSACPGEGSPDWRLSVQRGRNGADAQRVRNSKKAGA